MDGAVSNSHAKILMISARSDTGGGPAHMFELSDSLAGQVQIYAALPSDGLYYGRFLKRLGPGSVFEMPRQKFTIKALVGLLGFSKQQQITLIHSHGKGAGTYSRLLGMLLGIPVVHTLHGYHDVKYSVCGQRLYAAWEKLASCVTSKIICVSNSEAELFRKKVGIPEAKLVVIPNGTRIQSEMVNNVVPNKVVTVARFDYQKNLLELLRVARMLPEYDFNVIGDGDDRFEIETYIAENDLNNVRLSGMSQQVLTDISDASLYLTTSRLEGLPLAVLEAMSLGIPVVASDVVGNRDAVAVGVTGYLYPLGDVKAAACVMKDALKLDRALIKKHHHLHFSSERMVAATLALYQSVLSEKR